MILIKWQMYYANVHKDAVICIMSVRTNIKQVTCPMCIAMDTGFPQLWPTFLLSTTDTVIFLPESWLLFGSLLSSSFDPEDTGWLTSIICAPAQRHTQRNLSVYNEPHSWSSPIWPGAHQTGPFCLHVLIS